MKILRAEKFQPKKRDTKKQKTKLHKTDWDVLMQHDRFSGKLNLGCEADMKDPDSVKRLMEAGMIDLNHNLTPKGKQKFAELTKKLSQPESLSAAVPEFPKTEQPGEPQDRQVDKLTASDWAVLMKYDRNTGNLLKYDPETGELDQTSRTILQDSAIIQRLIDNHMILPDGWLTPEAKKRCGSIEKKSMKQSADDYPNEQGFKRLNPNPEPLSKDEFQANEIPGRDSETEKEKNLFPEKLPKKPNDENMQIFFENLPYDYSDTKDILNANLEPLSKGDRLSNMESSSMNENLPSKGPVLGQESKIHPVQELKEEAEKTKEPTPKSKPPFEESASIKAMRSIKHKSTVNIENEREENLAKKKRGSDSTGGTTTGPPKLSMRDIFHTIFKRKLEIFLFFFSVLLIVAIGTFLAKPIYKATAQLLVKIGRESIFVPATGNMNPVISYNREERINSEIEILKSRTVVEKLLTEMGPTVIYESLKENDNSGILSRLFPDRDPKASPDEIASMRFKKATKMIQEALQVESILKSDVIQISFQHEDPQMAAKVVNKLADIYLERHLEVHKAPKNVKFFQDQSQRLKDNLEKSEEKLKSLKELHNISHLEEERSLLLRETSDLQAELNKTLSQEVETEKRILQIEQQLRSIPKTVSQEEETDQNPYLMNTLEARLVELQLKEKELLAKYTDESRLVRNVKDEIRIVKQKLEEQENKNYGRTSVGLNPTYQRLQETLFENEADLKAIRAKGQNQKNQLAEYKIKLDKLNQIEVSLTQLQQQVDVDRQNYKLYLTKFEESRISEAMDSEKIANVSLIQPASPPNNPISPNVKLNIMLAIFLGAFGGIGIAFSLEYIDDKIENVEDVEEKLQLPVLASIQVFREKATG